MTAPRFIYEYANHKRRAIRRNHLLQNKEAVLGSIDRMIILLERGMVTVDETISFILNA